MRLPAELVHAIELAAYRENRVQLDEMQSRMVVDEGHRLLDAAADSIRMERAGQVSERLFQETIAEHLQQHHSEAVLVVVGRRGEDAARDPNHLGSNIERVVRSSHRPVLIAEKTFQPIERAVIAGDGGRSVTAAVKFISASGLLSGVATTLLHVGDGKTGNQSVDDIQRQLSSAGPSVELEHHTGPVAETIAQVAASLPAQMAVLGAYGHSRIRQLVVGSTTTEVLLSYPCSMLVFH